MARENGKVSILLLRPNSLEVQTLIPVIFSHVERHSLLGHEATVTAVNLEDFKFYPYLMLVDDAFCL